MTENDQKAATRCREGIDHKEKMLRSGSAQGYFDSRPASDEDRKRQLNGLGGSYAVLARLLSHKHQNHADARRGAERAIEYLRKGQLEG